jgi:hypothetical protein
MALFNRNLESCLESAGNTQYSAFWSGDQRSRSLLMLPSSSDFRDLQVIFLLLNLENLTEWLPLFDHPLMNHLGQNPGVNSIFHPASYNLIRRWQ